MALGYALKIDCNSCSAQLKQTFCFRLLMKAIWRLTWRMPMQPYRTARDPGKCDDSGSEKVPAMIVNDRYKKLKTQES